MSLGQNIYRLRTQREMSQLSLAEELGVSRQSISKWETDASVPELDKLVKLSELFGVTIDELVKDSPTTSNDAPITLQAAKRSTAQTAAGIALLIIGALVFLRFIFLYDPISALVFSQVFFACGAICLLLRRHIGLCCCWAIFFAADAYLNYGTSIHWYLIFDTFNFTYVMNYTRLIGAWIHVLFLLTLMIITALRFRGSLPFSLREPRKTIIAALSGIALLLVFSYLRGAIPTSLRSVFGQDISDSCVVIIWTIFDWSRFAITTALLTLATGLIKRK